MKFSQRIGKTSIREAIQLESIDKELENRLWNNILNDFLNKLDDNSRQYTSLESNLVQICKFLWTEFFGERIDEIAKYSRSSEVYAPGVIDYIKKWFLNAKWYEKYDLIEFIATIEKTGLKLGFIEKCNRALEKEMSAYRIIDGSITQITSEEEIVAIEEAILASSKWIPVLTHLKTAIKYYSNRDNPDYRNSIKESISAVESLCVIITGDKDASLGKALSLIEKRFMIHGALKSAFSSLYGYTSDSGGIRHSLLKDDIKVTIEDAKFMLVSCSAFINYLKTKIEK